MLRSLIAGVAVFVSVLTLVVMGIDLVHFLGQSAPETTLPMTLSLPLLAFPLYAAAAILAWWGARAWGRWRFVALVLAVLPLALAAFFSLL